MPHAGLVVLDAPYNSPIKWLLNKLTLERVKLPEGIDWFVCCVTDGFAIVVDPKDEHDGIVAACVFQRQLWSSKSDPAIVIEKTPGGNEVHWSLTMKLREFEELLVTVRLGPSRIAQTLSAALTGFPRTESRFYWSAIDVYHRLGLNSYFGQASKWFYNGTGAWKKYFVSLGFEGPHVIRSRLANVGVAASKDENSLPSRRSRPPHWSHCCAGGLRHLLAPGG